MNKNYIKEQKTIKNKLYMKKELLFLPLLIFLFISCDNDYDRCVKLCDDLYIATNNDVFVDSVSVINIKGIPVLNVKLSDLEVRQFDYDLSIYPGKRINKKPVYQPVYDKKEKKYKAVVKSYTYEY